MNNRTLLQIAKEHMTPAYVYDLEKVREQITKLKNAFTYSRTRFLYAIKANFNPYLVKEIVKNGFGIDAVSPEEVECGILCGAECSSIMFTGNNMSNEDMKEVHRYGALLNIDSLSRLEKFGTFYPGSDVCIRFTTDIGAGNHKHNITGGEESKFGISHSQLQDVLDIINKYNLRLVGIHHHIGSGWLDVESPLNALEIILEVASIIPKLDFIDLGGGFGIPYKPDKEELDVNALGNQISEKFLGFCKNKDKELELRLEPGRYIVAQAGHLLVKVTTIKENPQGRIFVGVDSGMNHMIRVPLYDAYHRIINLSNQNGEQIAYDICGNVCESSDFFAKSRIISEIREGDILSIEDTGAYGFAMSSDYQLRSRPAEVIVDGNKIFLSRKREILKPLLSKYEKLIQNPQS